MKTKLLLSCIAVVLTLSSLQVNAQSKNISKGDGPLIFDHVSEYANLDFSGFPSEKPNLDLPPDPNMSNTPPSPELGEGKELDSYYWTYYGFGYRSEYLLTYLQGVTFSPGLYGQNNYYRYHWYPNTITFPQPADGVQINVWGSYYGATLIAYNEDGNYLGQVSSNFGWWGSLVYYPPSGQKIGYIVLQNSTYYGYSYYTQYMYVLYQSNNAPVAIAQDVSVNTQSNCSADVTASQVDNGSYDPDGDALTYSLSPAGPYSLGTTNVVLTVSDGELSSTASATITVSDVEAPVVDVANLSDITGECSASVNVFPTATDNCSGSLTGFTSDPLYYDEQGTYIINWTFDDGNGNTTSQQQTVIVDDVTVPVLNVESDPITMWPPNHKYQTVNLNELLTGVSDNCTSLSNSDVVITSVSSDEEEDAGGGGDGNTTNDIVIASDCQSVQLRKERQGNGNGRVYTINMQVDDGNGNITTASYEVHVPKNKNGNAINDGVEYSVSGDCGSKSAGIQNNDISMGNKVNVYPNPTSTKTNVEITLSEDNMTTVRVYNSMGQNVATLFDSYMDGGVTKNLSFDASNLSKGIYYIRLQSGNSFNKTTKLIITK